MATFADYTKKKFADSVPQNTSYVQSISGKSGVDLAALMKQAQKKAAQAEFEQKTRDALTIAPDLVPAMTTGGTTPVNTIGSRIGDVLVGALKSTAAQYTNTAGMAVKGAQELNTLASGTAQKVKTAQDNIARYQQEIQTQRRNGTLTNESLSGLNRLISANNRAIKAAQGNLNVQNAGTGTGVQKLNQTADRLQAGAESNLTEAKQGLGKVGSALVDIGAAGTQMAVDAGTAALTGSSALVPMFIRSFGGGAQQARQAGASVGTQAAYGLGSGAIETATEKIFNVAAPFRKMFGAGVLDSAVQKVIGKLAQDSVGKALLTAGASAAGEGFEEFVGDALYPILQRATYDKSAKFDLGSALYDSMIGGALGLIGTSGEVVGGISTAIQNKSDTPILDSVKAGQTTAQNAFTATGAVDAGVNAAQAQNVAQEVNAPQTSDNGTVMNANATGAKETPGDAQNKSVGAANLGFDPYSQLQGKYGTITPGENPSRVVDIPKQTTDDNYVSKATRTISEAQATPDSRIPALEGATVDGKFSYIPVENTTRVQDAEQRIADNGWQAELNDWSKKVAGGKIGADVVAEGAVLLNNIGNSNATAKQYLDLVADYTDVAHRFGQGLQAQRILKTLTPQGQLYLVERSARKIVEDMGNKFNVTIDQDLAQNFIDAKTDTEKNAALDAIQQNVADQIPSTVMDKVTAVRYLNMLGNLKTQVRNVAGNAGMQPVRIVKDKIGAAIELAASKVSGGKIERTKSFTADPALFKEAWGDFDGVKNEALGEGKYQTASSQTMRDIQDKRTVFKNNGTWGTQESSNPIAKGVRSATDILWKVPEGYRKATNWAMEHGDIGFSRFTYADALSGYLKAHGVKTISDANTILIDNAREYAIKQAQEATYRDNNQFSDMIASIGFKRNLTASKRAVNTVLQGVMPFRRTPANILVRAEEYSPLGLVNTAVKAAEAANGSERVTASDVIDSLAKSLTGTGIAMLGYALYSSGRIRGSGSDDDKQDKFDTLLGHQSYSLELPNGTSLTLDWLAPESMPFFVGVQFAQAAADGGLSFKDGLTAVSSISDPMLQMSMLQGVNDSLENIKYNYGNQSSLALFAGNAAASFLTQGLTNTLAGQLKRASEPNRMTTYVDKNDVIAGDTLQRILGKASAKTPGWNYHQIEYIDAWGRTQSNGDVLSRIINQTINPAYTSTVNVDDVERALQAVADKTGNTSVFPSTAGKSFNYTQKDGAVSKSINLTAEQYTKYAKALGKTRYSLLNEAISSSYYKGMTDTEKADYISSVYSYANSIAKDSVVGTSDKDTWITTAKDSKSTLGVSTAEYIALHDKYGSAVVGSGIEKVKPAVAAGMSVDDYMALKDSLDVDGNKHVSQDEAKSVLNNSKLSWKQKDVLWQTINKSWKNNPYK